MFGRSREVRRSQRRAPFDGFKQSIIGQESGGRYGVPNADGSGAMGVGQVMPATGKALAARIGLPWRPDLMAGTSVDARRYQDQITHAATQEAWNAAHGNPRIAAMYYHGGSDQSKWGPKTQQYANDILARMN